MCCKFDPTFYFSGTFICLKLITQGAKVMLRNMNTQSVVLWNFFLMIAWHLLALILCKILNKKFFDPRRKKYLPKKWEKNGLVYINFFKIKKWKDRLPQYISHGGFSKESLSKDLCRDPKYLDRFIMETCRAEWNHKLASCYFLLSTCINSLIFGIVFSIIPLIANLPFILIQRYNRIRLTRLRKRKLEIPN